MLNKETKAIIDKTSKADGNHTVAANVVFHAFSVLLSRNNIHSLSGLGNEVENLDGIKELHLMEKTIDYQKNVKQSYIVIS